MTGGGFNLTVANMLGSTLARLLGKTKGLSAKEFYYFISLPGRARNVLNYKNATTDSLKHIYEVQEHIDHFYNSYIATNGLYGWGKLDLYLLQLMQAIVDLDDVFTLVLGNESDLANLLQNYYNVGIPLEYKACLQSYGFRYCLIDNIIGNVSGIYSGKLIDKDDLEYLMALFSVYETDAVKYELVHGNSERPNVKIIEVSF